MEIKDCNSFYPEHYDKESSEIDYYYISKGFYEKLIYENLRKEKSNDIIDCMIDCYYYSYKFKSSYKG